MTKICGTKFQFNTRTITILSIIVGVFTQATQTHADTDCRIQDIGSTAPGDLDPKISCSDISCKECKYLRLQKTIDSRTTIEEHVFTTCTSCKPGYILSSYTNEFYSKTDDCTNKDIRSNYENFFKECIPCPSLDDVFTDKGKTTKAQYTSDTGATSKTDCYLPSGIYYYNVKGTFTLSNQCNWKEKN